MLLYAMHAMLCCDVLCYALLFLTVLCHSQLKRHFKGQPETVDQAAVVAAIPVCGRDEVEADVLAAVVTGVPLYEPAPCGHYKNSHGGKKMVLAILFLHPNFSNSKFLKIAFRYRSKCRQTPVGIKLWYTMLTSQPTMASMQDKTSVGICTEHEDFSHFSPNCTLSQH